MNYDLLIANFKLHDIREKIFHDVKFQEIPLKKAIKKLYPSIIKELKTILQTNFKQELNDLDFKTELKIKLELDGIESYIYINLITEENSLNAYSYYKQIELLKKDINKFIKYNYIHLKDFDYIIIK